MFRRFKSLIILCLITVLFYFILKTLGDGGSGVVQTAWAVLGLLACESSDRVAIDRGVQFLMDKQVGLCVCVCLCVCLSL
jgi:Squalene-hopene cyclase C-terminal domain